MDYQMHTTLAMSGIVTPHKAPPSTPRGLKKDEEGQEGEEEKKENTETEEIEAQPIFVNPHYYSYGYGASADGAYVPPSPATQFMMSPQANSQAAAYYAFNPYYSQQSPRRSVRHRGKGGSPPRAEESKISNPPPMIRKTSDADPDISDSEVTCTTVADSESVVIVEA